MPPDSASHASARSPRSSARPDSFRVLWVTDEPPDPGLGGGSIRQFHLLEALASALPTDLVTVGVSPHERIEQLAAGVTTLPRGRVQWSEHPVARRALSLAITLASQYPSAMYPTRPVRQALSPVLAERRQRYSVICVEHEGLAPVIPAVRRERWVLTFHYLLSGMIERELALAPGGRQRWYRERDLSKARRLEREALNRFDRCIACSEEDARTLRSIGEHVPTERVAVIPNGVDVSRFQRSPVPSAPRILLPGHLAWHPNVDGARWFCSEMWPRILTAMPDAELQLVGRAPTADVLALGRLPHVTVHPDVPSMVPYFEGARVIVVPLRVGTGTRLKALEGMAAARPVVGTSVGLEGIGIIDGTHALVADDSESLAAAVIRVLRDDDLAGSLARAGRAHVEGQFDWETVAARFVAMVSELAEGASELTALSTGRG